MTRHVTMQWNLRQVMADSGIFQTSELLPLLQQRGVQLSRDTSTGLSPAPRSGSTSTSSPRSVTP
jgi:hypothetical protein